MTIKLKVKRTKGVKVPVLRVKQHWENYIKY